MRIVRRARCAIFAVALSGALFAANARAELPTRPAVVGADVIAVEVGTAGAFAPAAWDDLAKTARVPGTYTLRLKIAGTAPEAIELPVCAGRGKIALDGVAVPGVVAGPVIVRVGAARELTMEVAVSGYEKRIACGAPPRAGAVRQTREGLSVLGFPSPSAAAGGGRAVVFFPPGHDASRAGPLLVGAHPWNGGIWTYAAYAELLREATLRDVVLLMPSGLGNSLYTAAAETEVLRAIDALTAQMAIDPRRVSLWGASMGGAGATTIGLHHPDKFAMLTSFFGDSRYDVSTYVRSILADEAAAHLVNGLDVVDNARHVPIWLVHGEDDHTSPITQSSMLARALTERHYAVRFDRVPHAGHEGTLVGKFGAEMVARAAEARVPEHPARVTFKSVRASDTEAYGIRIVRSGGDAQVEVERRADGVHVLRATGVRAIGLARGALGSPEGTPIVLDAPLRGLDVHWDVADAGAGITNPP